MTISAVKIFLLQLILMFVFHGTHPGEFHHHGDLSRTFLI